jgi:hypothetical protein
VRHVGGGEPAQQQQQSASTAPALALTAAARRARPALWIVVSIRTPPLSAERSPPKEMKPSGAKWRSVSATRAARLRCCSRSCGASRVCGRDIAGGWKSAGLSLSERLGCLRMVAGRGLPGGAHAVPTQRPQGHG